MPNTILVINKRHMGDVIMSSAALQLIRTACPHARITLLVPALCVPLMRHPALADEVLAEPRIGSFRGLHKTLEALRLRGRRYDACFLFGESATNARRLKWLSGIPTRICASRDMNGSPNKTARFCTHVVPTGSVWTEHVADWYQDIVRGYFSISGSESLRLAPVEPFSSPDVDAFFQSPGPHIALCFHGSDTGLSSWPEVSAVALVKRLAAAGCRLFMAYPPDDTARALRIREASGVPIFVRGTTISECAALLKKADLLLSVDTGQVHMAAALGTPVLSLAGSTLTGTYPYSETGLAIGCVRHCFDCRFLERCPSNRKKGKKHMPGYVPPCMEAIDPEIVYAYALRMLESPRGTERYALIPSAPGAAEGAESRSAEGRTPPERIASKAESETPPPEG